MKKNIASDMSVDAKHARLLHNVIDYIEENTKYLSNEERQSIQVKDYLEKHHFTSHAAYQQYADDLLKHKVEIMLGEMPEKSDSAMVNWELGINRTMPAEHLIQESIDSVLYRDDITRINKIDEKDLLTGLHGDPVPITDAKADSAELIEYRNPVTGNIETDTIRNIMNKKVYREAQVTVMMNEDIKPARNMFENLIIKEFMNPEVRHKIVEGHV